MQSLVRRATPADEGAVLALLRQHDGLEVEFDADTFAVAVDGADGDGEIVACARLRRHADGALELASVATQRAHHGRGLGSALVRQLLADVREPVYALALAPGFFARHGFREIAREALPASARAKAEGMCASQPYKAMLRP